MTPNQRMWGLIVALIAGVMIGLLAPNWWGPEVDTLQQTGEMP